MASLTALPDWVPTNQILKIVSSFNSFESDFWSSVKTSVAAASGSNTENVNRESADAFWSMVKNSATAAKNSDSQSDSQTAAAPSSPDTNLPNSSESKKPNTVTAENRQPPAGDVNPNNIPETVWTIDRLRTREFEQYVGLKSDRTQSDMEFSSFQDTLKAMKEKTGKTYALIYVIANPHRLELILVPPVGNPIHRSVPEAPRQTLLAVAKELQQQITDRRDPNSIKYLQPARQLYHWIISPLEKDLQELQVDTLLFSMDAGLRTMPIAALYDGQEFLVEKYSFSLIPSFTLTDWNYQALQNDPILAFGASEFSDQTPLPAVPVELQQILAGRSLKSVNSLSDESKSFLNREFTLNNLKNQRAATPFRIVHLATHADFQPGAPSNSYIQLWDRKLHLDELRQLNWNNPQVGLLVLSACRTALGDEQAEMGFAGLAVISGAKSAVASLWYVSDLGTLGLMSEFYQNLREAPIKAEALRQAQIAMIRGILRVKDGQFIGSNGTIQLPPELAERSNLPLSHPYYWSAFTTIGSPW